MVESFMGEELLWGESRRWVAMESRWVEVDPLSAEDVGRIVAEAGIAEEADISIA